MTDTNLSLLHKQTLIQMIENAPGTKLFSTLFVKYEDSGEVKDVCNDGEYSCAFFVSSLLTLTGYLARPHATVAGLRTTLLTLPFQKVESAAEAQPGDIIFWDKIVHEDGTETEHIGFVSKNGSVSTNFKKQMVIAHPVDQPGGEDSPKRAITLILRPQDQLR